MDANNNTPLYGYYSNTQKKNTKKLFIYKKKDDGMGTLAATEVSSVNPTTFLKNTKLNDMKYIGEVRQFIKVCHLCHV
jgi:hypothetical protein